MYLQNNQNHDDLDNRVNLPEVNQNNRGWLNRKYLACFVITCCSGVALTTLGLMGSLSTEATSWMFLAGTVLDVGSLASIALMMRDYEYNNARIAVNNGHHNTPNLENNDVQYLEGNNIEEAKQIDLGDFDTEENSIESDTPAPNGVTGHQFTPLYQAAQNLVFNR